MNCLIGDLIKGFYRAYGTEYCSDLSQKWTYLGILYRKGNRCGVTEKIMSYFLLLKNGAAPCSTNMYAMSAEFLAY